MSTNCMNCVIRDRTSPRDGLCDRCRKLDRIKSTLDLHCGDTTQTIMDCDVRWLLSELEQQENKIYQLMDKLANCQVVHQWACELVNDIPRGANAWADMIRKELQGK